MIVKFEILEVLGYGMIQTHKIALKIVVIEFRIFGMSCFDVPKQDWKGLCGPKQLDATRYPEP